MRTLIVLAVASLSFCFPTPIPSQSNSPLTFYEKSGYKKTPRYRETIRFCQLMDSLSPMIQYSSFGISPQGRALPLLILDSRGNFTPEAVRASGNAVLLIQAGIHAGEIDGKDAGLMLIRDILFEHKFPGTLEHTTVLFIPIFNVDGHERFGPFNRINQNGPEEMGWRTTAQNLNLNRDFLKADTPEMQAWLKLFHAWLPDFLVDCHVTDGADYQYAVTYGLENSLNVAPPLRRWVRNKLEPLLNKKMRDDRIPMFPYFWLKDRHDIRKGIINLPLSPRYSNGYGAAQNRVFFLIETHMLKDYRTRVNATYHLLLHILETVDSKYDTLQQINRKADEYTATELPGRYLPLNFRPDMNDSTMVWFEGVDFTIEHSDISGGEWIRWGNSPRNYRLPFFNIPQVTDSALVPQAYLIPREWSVQIKRLQMHGVSIRYLANDTLLSVESYRFRNPRWEEQPFEGRHRLSVELDTIREQRWYPAGSAVILMNQRANRVAVHLLEPKAPDSFVSWGFWDVLLERKEYGEDYVLEKLARKMLNENPAIRDSFEKHMATDPDFAGNPMRRLYFFYQNSPYWDQKMNVYPVGKLLQPVKLRLMDTEPVVERSG